MPQHCRDHATIRVCRGERVRRCTPRGKIARTTQASACGPLIPFNPVFFDHGIGQHLVRDLLHFSACFFAVGTGVERNLEVFSLANGCDRSMSQCSEGGTDGLALRIEHSGLHRNVHASNHFFPFYRPSGLPWARTALKTLKTTAAILFWPSIWLMAAQPQLKQRDPL